MVKALTKELQIQHKKSTPYHSQENGTVEAFNKILDTTLAKVFYIIPSLHISIAMGMDDATTLEECAAQLIQLE